MKRTTKIDRNDPNLFSHKSLFKCVPIDLKNVRHTKICIVLHLTPNMANITQKHGYTKMERLVLELDIIKYMYGSTHDTHTKVFAKHEIMHLQCTPQ